MGSLTTDLPIVQLAKLTDKQREKLLTRIFGILEYDEEGRPGADRSAGDIASCMMEAFNDFGVLLSDPNHMPAGYRINDHQTPGGGRCYWSEITVAEPMRRTPRGNIRCAKNCPASLVEADPRAEYGDEEVVDIYGVMLVLGILGVPFLLHEVSAGEFVLYIGRGVWDEAAERHTHPMSVGPCYLRRQDRLVAFTHDMTWGLRGDGDEAHRADVEHVDAERFGRDLAKLFWEQVPPVLTDRAAAA